MILEELEDERYWDEAFARSPDVLAFLATEAMTEYRAGKTQELDCAIAYPILIKR